MITNENKCIYAHKGSTHIIIHWYIYIIHIHIQARFYTPRPTPPPPPSPINMNARRPTHIQHELASSSESSDPRICPLLPPISNCDPCAFPVTAFKKIKIKSPCRLFHHLFFSQDSKGIQKKNIFNCDSQRSTFQIAIVMQARASNGRCSPCYDTSPRSGLPFTNPRFHLNTVSAVAMYPSYPKTYCDSKCLACWATSFLPCGRSCGSIPFSKPMILQTPSKPATLMLQNFSQYLNWRSRYLRNLLWDPQWVTCDSWLPQPLSHAFFLSAHYASVASTWCSYITFFCLSLLALTASRRWIWAFVGCRLGLSLRNNAQNFINLLVARTKGLCKLNKLHQVILFCCLPPPVKAWLSLWRQPSAGFLPRSQSRKCKWQGRFRKMGKSLQALASKAKWKVCRKDHAPAFLARS